MGTQLSVRLNEGLFVRTNDVQSVIAFDVFSVLVKLIFIFGVVSAVKISFLHKSCVPAVAPQ
jgi:uncharacterized membrane protein